MLVQHLLDENELIMFLLLILILIDEKLNDILGEKIIVILIFIEENLMIIQ
jgi:hypothetical protein